MSIKLGITGGIGAGKSVVSHLLEVLGVPVYISDDRAKQLTASHPVICSELRKLVGNEVYKGGVLNKQLLASFLFECADNALRVNQIIHPVVKADFAEWVSQNQAQPILAMESAILIESGFADTVDYVVMVYAPLEVRLKRAMLRDGANQLQIEKRIQVQMCDEEKRLKADYIILNDGESPLIPQVLELISSLSQNNRYLCPAKNNY